MKSILLLIVLFLLSPYAVQVQADEWKNLPPDVQKHLTDLGEKEIRKEKIIEKETLKWLSSLDKGQYRKACNMLFGMFAWDDKEYENYVSGLKNARHTLGKINRASMFQQHPGSTKMLGALPIRLFSIIKSSRKPSTQDRATCCL